MLSGFPIDDLPDPHLREFLGLLSALGPVAQQVVTKDITLRATRTRLLQHAYTSHHRYFHVTPPPELAGAVVHLVGVDPAYAKA